MILIGLANAALFHRTGYRPALATEGRLPAAGRLAGVVSLAFWMGVMVCACLDTEAAPKVILRS